MVNARMDPPGPSGRSDLIDVLAEYGRGELSCETGENLGRACDLLLPSEIPQAPSPSLCLEDMDSFQDGLEGIGRSRPEISSEETFPLVARSHCTEEEEELPTEMCPALESPACLSEELVPGSLKSQGQSGSDATQALFWASILQAQMCVLDLQGEIDRQKELPRISPSLSSPEKVLGTPLALDLSVSREALLLDSDSGEEPEECSERQGEDEGSIQEDEDEEEEMEYLFYNNPLFQESPCPAKNISSAGPAFWGHTEEEAGITAGGLVSRNCDDGLLGQMCVAVDSHSAPELGPGTDLLPSYVPHYRSLSPLVITEGDAESTSPLAEEIEAQGCFPVQMAHDPSSTSALDRLAPPATSWGSSWTPDALLCETNAHGGLLVTHEGPERGCRGAHGFPTPGVDSPAQDGLLFSASSTSLVSALLQDPHETSPTTLEAASPAESNWTPSSFQALLPPDADQSRWQEDCSPQAPSCGHPLPSCTWVEGPKRTSCLQEEVSATDLHSVSLGGVERKLESSAEGLEMVEVPVMDGSEAVEEDEDEEERTPAPRTLEEPPTGEGSTMKEAEEQVEPDGSVSAKGGIATPGDQAAALRLARRLYHLEGFKRSQVSSFLRKNNDFSQMVAEAYLSFFHFSGQTLDQALRSFLKAFVLTGETQERERILRHFSQRYHCCNPQLCLSPDAVHTLTCAIMLLNTDLHGQNIGQRMTWLAFLSNLEGLNDGGSNFPKELLKALYYSIRQEKLEWAIDEDLPGGPPVFVPLPASQKRSNPFLTLPHDPGAKTYQQGLLARKVHAEADCKRTSWGKRSWKIFHTVLKGMVLYFSKDESWPDGTSGSEEPIGVHHALAEKDNKYTKRPHVFRLQTADWRVFLFQAPTSGEMSSWISRINLVAAMFSSPPFPAAVGSQRKFIRPILPTAPCQNSLEEQHMAHEGWMDSMSDDLLDHQRNLPSKHSRGPDLEKYRLKKEYLLYEKRRYETYVRLLEVKLRSATEDLDQWEAQLGEAELAEESPPTLQKSHSSPSLNVDGLPAGVKVKRNISERRTVRKIIPRRNKHLL